MAESKKRGRPVGSRNKPKVEMHRRRDGSAVINIKMEKQLEGTPVNRVSGQGWVRWGLRNDYPASLAELYYNSVTHKACIDFARNAILGGGVDYEKMAVKESELTPNYQSTWNDVISALAMDYVLYGCFALQIIKNNDGQTYSFFHQPMSQVRFSEPNEDGVVESYWICSDWTQTGLYQPVEIPSFSFAEEDEIKSGKVYLYVYYDYSPMTNFYPVPHYISALKAIQTEIELQRFDLRSVLNNFSASGILTLNRVDDDDERELLIQNITSMFSGSDNANSLIINFKNNDEEKPAEFTKIEKDAGDSVDLFANTNVRIIEKIVTAHKITDKGLIGYPVDGASLGGGGNVREVSFKLYMTLFGNNMQRKIVNSINNALKMNGVDTELVLKPLVFASSSSSSDVVDKQEDTERATSENGGNNLDGE